MRLQHKFTDGKFESRFSFTKARWLDYRNREGEYILWKMRLVPGDDLLARMSSALGILTLPWVLQGAIVLFRKSEAGKVS